MRHTAFARAVVVLCLAAFLVSGCLHHRYQVPAVLGVGGAAMTVGGAVALVPLADNQAGRTGAVSIMAAGVVALLIAAVWLGVRIRCDTAVDCPEGDTCMPVPTSGGGSYGVCVTGQQ